MVAPNPMPQAPYGEPELSTLASQVAAGIHPPEPQAAEHSLWQRHLEQHDLVAREELILIHLPYARAVAAGLYRQHVHHEVDLQEYVQWATLGLIEAVDRYDPDRGAQFRTYAHSRMQGTIRNGLEHISERQEQISLHRKLAAERLAAAQGERRMADASRSPSGLIGAMAEISAGLILSFMLDDTGMLDTPGHALPDGCYESLAFKHERQRLHHLIGLLTPREQAVVRLHDLQGLTYEDIAQSLGITKGRVSQLHEQALTRLRKLIQP
jgi:RNA polymerase sigma factor for flagellar operon FliA